jgi:hypothetical protein
MPIYAALLRTFSAGRFLDLSLGLADSAQQTVEKRRLPSPGVNDGSVAWRGAALARNRPTRDICLGA